MSERPRDEAFEVLVEVTRANVHFERGAINKALSAIKACARDEGIIDVAKEIRLRAELYKRRWPGAELTPPALAKHWIRVAEVKDERTASQVALDELRSRVVEPE